MAEQLKAGTVDNPKHNVQAMNKAIVDGFQERFKQEMEVAKAEERHMKPLKDTLKKHKRNMKADTGIDGIGLDNQYRVYKRQEQAKLLEEDDSMRIADNLRIVYEAMAQGGQLDFVDSLGD